MQLRQRNVYTLPTPAGLMFTALLLVLLIASVNYQLSLGYGLTFLLMGSGLVSMLITERQLAGLHLSIAPAPAGYQGQAIEIWVELRETAGRVHRSVGLGFMTPSTPTVWVDIAPHGRLSVMLPLPAPQRGVHALPALRIESRYPYGLLRAWSLWRPAPCVTVWPRPEHPAPAWPRPMSAPLPAHRTPISRRAAAVHERHTDIDAGDLRPYRYGDSPRKLAWKATARSLAQGGMPLSRDGACTPSESAAPPQPLMFDWADTADLPDPEARLQRLCAWIKQAHPGAYGLILPAQTLSPSSSALGEEHHRRCLDALARMP